MNVSLKKQCLTGLIGIGAVILSHAATPIEGYWKSMDDQTGEPLSVVKITPESDGTYTGTIVYRYPNARGITLENCDKCPEPYKGKPIIGLKMLTGLVQDKKDPNLYIHAKAIDAKSGKVYDGKVWVAPNGRQLKMRGYIGVSILGRSNVWLRIDAPPTN